MFTSVQHLENHMGVNHFVGRFFVDRKLPENNSFWKGRLLYISFGNGFVSIPVYYDILYRLGVPLTLMLNEDHICFMEQLMHYAILQERNEISYSEELDSIRNMLNGRIRNQQFYKKLSEYLNQPVLKPMGLFGMKYASLNRADVFLYILCDLPMDELQLKKALRYWYALHSSYLIMDDIRDFTMDKKDGQENVVIELGGGTDGFEKAFEMIHENSRIMEELNPLLGKYLLNNEEKLRRFIPVKF